MTLGRVMQIDDAYANGAVGQRIAKMNGFYNKLGAGAKPLNNKYPEVGWMSTAHVRSIRSVLP
jgi:hypothetical protein